ncbi:hypothetical protein LXA43DRAFT_1144962 [Ganoderma leucocontextum]|nr:hypothetical protein LXA43DRAFT_1144962 [Ganoderma leucocontextum]
MSKFTPTPAEVALINHIFAQADTQKIGVITGDAAVKIFSGSKLSPTVLAEIWNVADEDNNGVLTRKGVGIAVRLLGHAQRGENISDALISKPGPLPNIEGLPPVAAPSSFGVTLAKSPPPAVSGFPPLTPQDKAKFLKLFLGCHPNNGLLSGEKARDVFVKSKLPVEKLSQIWTLADTKNRGSLDATDFTIAMYLIQASMSGQLETIPPTLPPFLYDQAQNGIVPQATGDSGHTSPSFTGSFTSRPLQPQYTGQALSQIQPQMTGQTLSSIQPQTTGPLRSTAAPPLPARSALSTGSSPFIQQQTTGAQWDVTPQEKAGSDRLFDGLDPQKRGFIEGDVAVPFMLQSKLPEEVLAQVWDLADLNNDGCLTRDGFAVAMHLIQSRLAGKEIPTAIPTSLIPPYMRGSVGAGAAQPAVPEAIKDLLWDDSPPPSATVPTHPSTLQPQSTGPILQAQSTESMLQMQTTGTLSNRPTPAMSPPPRAQPTVVSDPFGSSPFGASAVVARDLLGDDDEPHTTSAALHDQSAEIGNVKNQLGSTTRSLETAKNERVSLERLLTEQAALLSGLQTQLSSAKASYDTETKLLSTLKERYAIQAADIQKTREELIHAESDLSATKVEKAEIEGALMREREEVRDLQRKMTETGTLIESTKAELEKLRKEAKQQKGLLAIAKKQLATREAEKAKVDKELEEVTAELQGITRERGAAEAELNKETPAALTNGHSSIAATPELAFAAAQPLPVSKPTSPDLSPPATKSTNPFERLAMSGTPRPESPFLPFVATSTILTPPTAPAAQEQPDEKDPFGFNQPFEAPAEPSQIETREPSTPRQSVPSPITIGSPTSQDIISPAETDLFTTPPTTATVPEHIVTTSADEEPTVSARFPALDDLPANETATTPTDLSTATLGSKPLEHEGDTDLTHDLKEIEESESDTTSDSDEEDDEPLTTVKAKLTETTETKINGIPSTSSTSAFDDSFGIPAADEQPAQASSAATPSTSIASGANDFESIFDTAATFKESPPPAPIPETATPKANGVATPGVNEFDQALGKLTSADSAASEPQFPGGFGGFDSAFDDNFDFAAASAAQPTQPSTTASTASAAFPPAPTTAAPTKGTSFDDVFGTSALSAAAPVPAPAPAIPTFPPVASAMPAQPAKTLSFDDAFGAASHPAPDLAASTSSQTNGTGSGFSFEDAFGGNDEVLALDSSFSTVSSFPPPAAQQPPVKGVQQPFPTQQQFPTSSPLGSPRGSSSTQPGERRSSSPSIRLPFGRKKKEKDAPPVPALSQQQIVEDPTPAVEDDVEAVKTLCGMGFSRTQAVAALEEHGYDVQRALNSLLGTFSPGILSITEPGGC